MERRVTKSAIMRIQRKGFFWPVSWKGMIYNWLGKDIFCFINPEPKFITMAEKAFGKSQIKNLDEVVISALELFIRERPPMPEIPEFRRPLVVGSGNAAPTGKILFHDRDAVFADESTFSEKIESIPGIDGAVIISASGGKHAPAIAKELRKRKIRAVLLTCNPEAPAKAFAEKTCVFPKQAEPYTYNVSTYLGMVLSKTGEDPKKILEHIKGLKIPQNLRDFNAFFLLVPERFELARPMLLKKFGELFGPMVAARAFTLNQAKHGETVIESEKELFISFGEKNRVFGAKRLDVPLPGKADYGAMLATGWHVIGQVQKQHPPYFRDSIEAYAKKASRIFGERIEPMVW